MRGSKGLALRGLAGCNAPISASMSTAGAVICPPLVGGAMARARYAWGAKTSGYLGLASRSRVSNQTPLAPQAVAVMSGFNFHVHRTTPQALAFLAQSPLAFGDSQWLEAHLDVLRNEPAAVLALLDFVTPQLLTELSGMFTGEPVRSAMTGITASGPRDAASFIRRRRELLANALASSTLGIREQMISFEVDICKTR